jgi:hypothetical protein
MSTGVTLPEGTEEKKSWGVFSERCHIVTDGEQMYNSFDGSMRFFLQRVKRAMEKKESWGVFRRAHCDDGELITCYSTEVRCVTVFYRK